MPTLAAVSVSASDVDRWSRLSGRPLLMSLAMAWARYAPRAKGWTARQIGRWLGRRMTATIRTRSGGIVAVDSSNLDIYVSAMLSGGLWERHVHDACAAIVRPGDVVFDIGANAGIISIDLAAHLNGNLRLIAFEPIPSLARAVALSAALNGLSDRVTVYEAMLGSKEGEASLYIPRHAVHASARPRERGVLELRPPRELKRPVYTLDALVGAGTIPAPDFIKVDVEGFELEVFRGAGEVLRSRMPPVVFEADTNMHRFGYTRRDLVASLSACGPYRFYYLTRRALRAADDLDEPLDEDHANMLALPPGRPVPSVGGRDAA